jgi:ribosome biogenesis GTPase
VASWGYRAVPVSVVGGEGLDSLMEVLAGRVTVVAGPSGAGKSSIINALRLRSLGLDSTLEAMQAEASGAPVAASEQEEEEEAGEHGDGGDERQQGGGGGAQPPAATGALAHQLQRQLARQQRQQQADLGLQAVGQVSQRIGRGKHTTRNVTLLELEGSGGGLVVDTPGFNQPDLSMPATELWQHFPEIQQLLEQDR